MLLNMEIYLLDRGPGSDLETDQHHLLLAHSLTAPYAIHMKRTNLVLDEELLKEVVRVSGERTYSGAVMRAMQDYLRRARAGRILELAGSGLWEGDLSAMRRDQPIEPVEESTGGGSAAG
jgi:Arc/MetJ family transcription regulator